MTAESIRVSVAFALAGRQQVVELTVPAGTTLDEAVALSDMQSQFAGIDLSGLPKGIWYEKRPGDTLLMDGDRVEIYRPLKVDAREARRRRAHSNKGHPA